MRYPSDFQPLEIKHMKAIYYRPFLETPPRNGRTFFDNIRVEPGLNELSESELEFFESTEDVQILEFYKTRVLEFVENGSSQNNSQEKSEEFFETELTVDSKDKVKSTAKKNVAPAQTV
jgi:hypothetical protein